MWASNRCFLLQRMALIPKNIVKSMSEIHICQPHFLMLLFRITKGPLSVVNGKDGKSIIVEIVSKWFSVIVFVFSVFF